jgi:hypothetical protein
VERQIIGGRDDDSTPHLTRGNELAGDNDLAGDISMTRLKLMFSQLRPLHHLPLQLELSLPVALTCMLKVVLVTNPVIKWPHSSWGVPPTR